MTDSVPLNEVVLVVDDEPAIREAVSDILEFAGVDTLLAANGLEAIELFQRERQRIGAVLLDMRMPVMSGAETYAKLRAVDTSTAIILSSGFDEAGATIDGGDDELLFFLHKPYSMDSLLAVVRRVLG